MREKKQEFISPAEAIRLSGLQPQYLYLLLRVAKIQAHKSDGRWFIDRKEFERQFAHRIVERKAEATEVFA